MKIPVVKDKGIPITDHEGPRGDVDARVHIFTATALGRGRVTSPTLGRLYPEESPRYSFYRRLSGPQDHKADMRRMFMITK